MSKSKRAAEHETWVDANGKVIYRKWSRYNRTIGLTREELEATKDLLSGTVTTGAGIVFHAPFKRLH